MIGTNAKTLAVVDPDPTNCMLLREIGLASGWSVAGCAQSVPEGMALLARSRPSCLITDYRFGDGATGLDLISKAKSLRPLMFTVVLTGWDINDVAAHVIEHAPDRILRKPVPPHLLMDMLEGIAPRAEVIRLKAV